LNDVEMMIARTLPTRRAQAVGGAAALRLAIKACGDSGQSLRAFAAEMNVSKTALINVLKGSASLTPEFALRASLAIESFNAKAPRRGADDGAKTDGEPPPDGRRGDSALSGRRSSMTRVKRRALEWLRLEAEFAIDTALSAHITARAAKRDTDTAS